MKKNSKKNPELCILVLYTDEFEESKFFSLQCPFSKFQTDLAEFNEIPRNELADIKKDVHNRLIRLLQSDDLDDNDFDLTCQLVMKYFCISDKANQVSVEYSSQGAGVSWSINPIEYGLEDISIMDSESSKYLWEDV